jgi:ribokinase
VDLFDSTGCGDAFCGVLAVLRVRGATLSAAIEAAQRAAAITAGRPGAYAALPTGEDLACCLSGDAAPHTHSKGTSS